MKILILHLSDIHIRDSKDINNENIFAIANALEEVKPFSKVWLFVSGDIAFSGEKKQYDAANEMIKNIIKTIKQKYNIKWVELFVVPGNHDMNLSDDIGHNEIQKKIRLGITEKDIQDELLKLRNFMDFSNTLSCLNNSSPISYIKTLEEDGTEFKICMVNSAIFSTKDEDKGLHYISQDEIEKIDKELVDGRFNIVVQHHAHHWMNDSVKSKFEKVLFSRCDIFICGHEHDIETEYIEKNGYSILYLTGGELANEGNWKSSEFDVYVIDTTCTEITTTVFRWDNRKKLYKNEKQRKYNTNISNMNHRIELDEEFKHWLYSDEDNEIYKNAFDYYVFPDLEQLIEYSTTERIVYSDENDFMAMVEKQKKVSIIGADGSGRTFLLKYLFEKMNRKGYCCIYCNSYELKNVSFSKMIRKMFRNCYVDDDGNFDQFLQFEKKRRVLLLDNVSDIQKDQIRSLIKEFENVFDIIVYTGNLEIEVDLAERIKQNAEMENYTRLKILPMYMKKRKILIEKILNLESERCDQELVNNIADAIKAQRKMYSMNASFVIQFTKFYLKNFKDSYSLEGNVFSKVFESNLVNRFNGLKKGLTIDKVMVLFDDIAYWCFKNEENDISQGQICDIIEKYNNIQGDNVSAVDIINAGEKAKILRLVNGNNYRFSEKNALSYFIARKIIRKWNDELDDSDLKYLIKYVKYGINANIVLFITYLTDNMYLIRNFIEATIDYSKDWDIFDVKKINISYLNEMTGKIHIETPTQKDRQKEKEREQKEDKKEIEEYEEEKIEVRDYFEIDVHDSEEKINQIIRSISLLDIVSKCLPSFEHRLTKDDKERIANIIFDLPGKIFYIWANMVDENKEDILEYLLSEYKMIYVKPRNWNNVKPKDMLIYLQVESILFLMDLMNLPIKNSAKDYTIGYLEKYCKEKKILNILQILMAYDKLDDVNKFEKYLMINDDALGDCIPDYMKRNVLRHFLITSKKISKERIQRLASIYFKNKTYNKIMISRERNKHKG